MQFPRGEERRRDVAPTVKQNSGNVLQTIHLLKDGRIAEPAVRPVVRGQPDEGVPKALVLPACIALEASRTDGDVGVLPERPLLRSRFAYDGVRRLHQACVRLYQSPLTAPVSHPRVLRVGSKAVPCLGEHRADAGSATWGTEPPQHRWSKPTTRMRVRSNPLRYRPLPKPAPGPPCRYTAGTPSGEPHSSQYISLPAPTSSAPRARALPSVFTSQANQFQGFRPAGSLSRSATSSSSRPGWNARTCVRTCSPRARRGRLRLGHPSRLGRSKAKRRAEARSSAPTRPVRRPRLVLGRAVGTALPTHDLAHGRTSGCAVHEHGDVPGCVGRW